MKNVPDFASLFHAKAKQRDDARAAGAAGGTVKNKGAAPPAAAAASSIGKRRNKKKRHKQEQLAKAAAAQPSAPPTPKEAGGGKLALKMNKQLAGAQFRFINEQLYTRPSAEAVQLFADEPELYEAYHEGFRLQAARWPQRPVQVIADWMCKQPRNWVVADLGCGDAELAVSVPHRVHSFDLVAANHTVVACDISNVPLGDGSVDVAVFCLALMGSNFADFLAEARRLIRNGGILKIAEVTSRIDNLEGWDALLHALGFDLRERDASNTHFVLYEYVKNKKRTPPPQLPKVTLKACTYKKR